MDDGSPKAGSAPADRWTSEQPPARGPPGLCSLLPPLPCAPGTGRLSRFIGCHCQAVRTWGGRAGAGCEGGACERCSLPAEGPGALPGLGCPPCKCRAHVLRSRGSDVSIFRWLQRRGKLQIFAFSSRNQTDGWPKRREALGVRSPLEE